MGFDICCSTIVLGGAVVEMFILIASDQYIPDVKRIVVARYVCIVLYLC